MENLITKLQETKKVSTKFLAKRFIRLNDKINNNQELYEIDEVQRRCYNLLLDLVDEDTKTNLLTHDAIIKILSSRLEKTSSWTMAKDNSFYHKANNYLYEVIPSDYGYDSKNHKLIEYVFIKENNKELADIYKQVEAKEEILNGNYNLKDERDSSLVEELIRVLGYKKEKEMRKVM